MSEHNVFAKKVESVVRSSLWKEYCDRLPAVKDSLTEKAAIWLLTTSEGHSRMLVPGLMRPYYANYFIRDITFFACSKYSKLGSLILKVPFACESKSYVISGGFYSDLSEVDDIAVSGNLSERLTAVKICSFDALRHLKNDKDHKIRKAALVRLGPVECLDDMLSDKMASIRQIGARAAPISYKKIETAILKEIAKGPFLAMVKKVSPEFLPMILANRNIKSKWVSKIVEERMLG